MDGAPQRYDVTREPFLVPIDPSAKSIHLRHAGGCDVLVVPLPPRGLCVVRGDWMPEGFDLAIEENGVRIEIVSLVASDATGGQVDVEVS